MQRTHEQLQLDILGSVEQKVVDIATSFISTVNFEEAFKYGVLRNLEVMLGQTLNYSLYISVVLCKSSISGTHLMHLERRFLIKGEQADYFFFFQNFVFVLH
jgi:hypothetical protein